MAICLSESKFHLVYFATLFTYLFGGGGSHRYFSTSKVSHSSTAEKH